MKVLKTILISLFVCYFIWCIIVVSSWSDAKRLMNKLNNGEILNKEDAIYLKSKIEYIAESKIRGTTLLAKIVWVDTTDLFHLYFLGAEKNKEFNKRFKNSI